MHKNNGKIQKKLSSWEFWAKMIMTCSEIRVTEMERNAWVKYLLKRKDKALLLLRSIRQRKEEIMKMQRVFGG